MAANREQSALRCIRVCLERSWSWEYFPGYIDQRRDDVLRACSFRRAELWWKVSYQISVPVSLSSERFELGNDLLKCFLHPVSESL